VTVTGRKVFVDAGTQADVLLVVARHLDSQGDPVLVRVDVSASGVARTTMPAVDVGRGLADVVLDGAPGQVVARGEGVLAAVSDAWLVGGVLTSADGVGLATRAMELSRDYSVTREQFGRPIAAFQSVKHKLVEMYIDLQTATSAVEQALDEIDTEATVWRTSASMATARASDAVMHVVREAVQVHGGIGFTWEHELSHHFRRATTLRAVYGTPAAHRRLVAESWDLS
jgi:alkylation response protein AidB-like acyl-CoA dehydrogenase